MNAARVFCDFEFLWERYKPLTPYGRADKETARFFTEAEELDEELDAVERFAKFLSGGKVGAAKLAYHLGRIPYIETASPARMDSASVFAVKKFLANAKAVFSLLPPGLASLCGSRWRSGSLFALLRKSGSDDETFHLSEAYSPALKEARGKIRVADAEIASIREAAHRRALADFGLDFRFRDFIVLDEASARKLFSSPLFFVEQHDSSRVLVRPVYGERYLEVCAAREKLVLAEKAAEDDVLASITASIRADRVAIEACRDAIRRIDVLRAKAELSLEFGLKRPRLSRAAGAIKIKNGRLLPLETRLSAEGLKYTPFNCELPEHACVITGSNMGGKTVALQTVVFLQLAAQRGLPVPADSFETPIFDAIHYIGDAGRGAEAGLSGFGLECKSLMDALPDAGRRALFVFDEFAKTTNSDEAGALLSALAEKFAAGKKARALFSTHFSGVESVRGLGRYRMRGLDAAAFSAYFGAEAGAGRGKETLPARLRMINRFMRYELLCDEGSKGTYDALKVARLLGVDNALLARAGRLLEDE